MSITPEHIVEFNPPIELAPVGENDYSVSEFMAVKQGERVRGFLLVDKFDNGSGDSTQHVYEIEDPDNFEALRGKTNKGRIAVLSESHINDLAEKGIREKGLKQITNPDEKDAFKKAVEGILSKASFTQAASPQSPQVSPSPAISPATVTVGLGKLGAG